MMSRLLPIFKYRYNATFNIHWNGSCDMQKLFLKYINNFDDYNNAKNMECRLQPSSKYCCNEYLDALQDE